MYIDQRGMILSEDGGEVVIKDARFSLDLNAGRGRGGSRWEGYADLPRGSRKQLNALGMYRIELEDGTWGLARFSSLLSDQAVRVVGKGPLHFPD